MELLKIYMSDASPERMSLLYDEISVRLNDPMVQHLNNKIQVEKYGRNLSLRCMPTKFKMKKDAPILFRMIGQSIACFVIKEIEPTLFKQLIRQGHKQFSREEVAIIEQYCINIIDSSDYEMESNSSRTKRQAKLASDFTKHMTDHQVMHIDGFITFRLPSYKEELKEVVEYAVEEYIMDKQYQEFITLLQYFVLLQDRKVPAVHIIHKEGSNFMILDEHFQPIEKKKTEDFVMELLDKDLNYEDMVISSLISISPEKICIHTRTKELQIIRTIQQIFENRTEICERCSVCHPVHEQYSLDH